MILWSAKYPIHPYHHNLPEVPANFLAYPHVCLCDEQTLYITLILENDLSQWLLGNVDKVASSLLHKRRYGSISVTTEFAESSQQHRQKA